MVLLLAPRGRNYDMKTEKIQFSQMKETLARLQGRNKESSRDLFKWRQAKIEEICADNMISKQQKDLIFTSIIDRLFLFEKVRMVYENIVRFDTV